MTAAAPGGSGIAATIAARLPAGVEARGRLVQIAPGVAHDIVALLAGHGCDVERAFVLGGAGPSTRHALAVAERFTAAGLHPGLGRDATGSVEEADRIAAGLRAGAATVVLGVGGGRVLDVAKYAAWTAGLDYVAVPTSLANDGIFSPVVSLTVRGTRTSLGTATPVGLVVDTTLVATAPHATVAAGVGDLLSNVTAVLDWRLATAESGEPFVPETAELALRAVEAYREVAWSPDRQTRLAGLAEGLVLSGLAMSVAGTSRPCSGSEHLVSHALDAILGSRARMHGEQVALGTLLALAAHDRPDEEIRELFRATGLPVRAADLGFTPELVLAALERGPSCRPDRYTVLTTMGGDRARLAGLMDRAFRP